MSDWWQSYKFVKSEFEKRGYELLNSRQTFRANYNTVSINPQQKLEDTLSEVIAFHNLTKRNESFITNLNLLDTSNNVHTIRKFNINKMTIMRTYETEKKLNFEYESIKIPEDVKELVKRRTEFKVLDGF